MTTFTHPHRHVHLSSIPESTMVISLLGARSRPVAHLSPLFAGTRTISDPWLSDRRPHCLSPFWSGSASILISAESPWILVGWVRVCCVRNSMTCASVQSIALWRFGGHIWNWECRSQSSDILASIVRSICAIRLLECSHMSRPSPQAVILCSRVSFIVHFLQVSVCTVLIRWRRSCFGIRSWMTRNQAIRVDSGTRAALRFSHTLPNLRVGTFLLHALHVFGL